MDTWSEVVKRFYAEKLASAGFNLDGSGFTSILQDAPRAVLSAYNQFGGEDSDPEPGVYAFRIQEQSTYAVTLTWGGGDGWLAVFDEQGQLLGAAYTECATDVNSIRWYNSLTDAMSGSSNSKMD
jgi:hypothetical protein